MAIVEFRNVDVIFGKDADAAAAMLDAGEGRQSILEKAGNVIGVHNASIAIQEGEICVLMGLSGSGKSTLLRCVNGLNKATRGNVLVRDGDGQVDVANCDPATLRRLRMNRIAMVFQQFALLPWRTVRENVGFGLELRGMSKPERDGVVEEKLKLVDLDAWKDKYAHELSGGMQQRVGLARAFATDADILLMDEPFSALDPLIRDHLQDELVELQQSLKKTIIFVSHDLDEALKIGTRIAIMESGRIVQIGRPEEIVGQPVDDYVRAFVANVNPLNVLRGAALMRPVEELDRADDCVLLDPEGECRCRLDGDGTPSAYLIDGAPARAISYEPGLNLGELDPACIVTGTPRTTMRAAVEVQDAIGRPMPLLDEAGGLVGVIGGPELLAGMARRGSNATA